MEIGIRHQLSSHLVWDAGLGRELTAPSDRSIFLALSDSQLASTSEAALSPYLRCGSTPALRRRGINPAFGQGMARMLPPSPWIPYLVGGNP